MTNRLYDAFQWAEEYCVLYDEAAHAAAVKAQQEKPVSMRFVPLGADESKLWEGIPSEVPVLSPEDLALNRAMAIKTVGR